MSMESVDENFSVVDGIHMITADPDDPDQLITSSETPATEAITHIIATSSKNVPASVKNSLDNSRTIKLSDLKAKHEEQDEHITDSISRIISTSRVPHIVAETEEKSGTAKLLDATQILTADSDEIMQADGKIFAVKFSEDELISGQTNHIIMDANSAIMEDGRQIIVTDKAHLLSSNGEVITVPSRFLDESGRLPDHMATKVIEQMSEEALCIKKEPEFVETSPKESTIQIKVSASAPRKNEDALSNEKGGSTDDSAVTFERTRSPVAQKYTHVDRDDPRSRLHFVKYMKRDGKTRKIWECGICGKEFMHQYTLMRHLPTHTDERNFRCNVCGKSFRQMSTLSQHKATHSESRPYVCDLCKKTFSRVSTLISHKKTHTDHKQHQCLVCGKAFHQKGNLKNHLFTHTNERPYKCDICGRGFNQASNLQCHKTKSHTDGLFNYPNAADRYKCNYCDSAYARRAQLRQHEEYKHGVRNIQGTKFLPENGPRMLSNNTLLKKRKIGNVRIIQLPNGDKTFQEIGINEQPMKLKKAKQKSHIKSGILIEPIDTKAMHRALAEGRTPFALLKPSKGVPVVVKVQFAYGSKHMLVPASASELRDAGKFTVSSQQSGTKAVQIKVPVVATVIQRIDEDGQVHMDVEAPEEPLEINATGLSAESITVFKEPRQTPSVVPSESKLQVDERLVMNPGVIRPSITEPVMEGEDEEHSVDSPMAAEDNRILIGGMTGGEHMGYAIDQDAAAIAAGASEGGEGINSVDLLATAVNLVSQAQISKDIDGIQYLRQVNMGEYEVVPADHGQATHIMNEQGQIEQIKMDDSNTVTMEQANISALMDALQNAGYHIGTGNQQIIINSDGQAMVVDQQQVQMVIDGDMEGVISSDGVVSDIIDPSSVNLVVHEVPEGIHPTDNDKPS